MKLQSTFESDLSKEVALSHYLDIQYKKKLRYYSAQRITNRQQQLLGVDVKLKHKGSGKVFRVDEKAQLDYLNEDLPTFAFELSYLKEGKVKKGWFFDTEKKTDFYALITGIYTDEPGVFTSCKITFVNRFKLIAFLAERNLTETILDRYIDNNGNLHGKKILPELSSENEAYLYFSRKNKAEQPVNLILKLAFLIQHGLAKRLV